MTSDSADHPLPGTGRSTDNNHGTLGRTKNEMWTVHALFALHNEISLWGLSFFMGSIVLIILPHGRKLFLDWHGRFHRWMGLLHIVILLVGINTVAKQSSDPLFAFLYDLFLGSSGIILTLTAAHDFPHRYVSNEASGTLAPSAIVTQGEIIEHAFYQFLNLCQALYLHVTRLASSGGEISASPYSWTTSCVLIYRWCALLLVTLPWYWRRGWYIPVHSFSQNWSKSIRRATSLERFLYRCKKVQYLFYKHIILHGLNLSMIVCYASTAADLVLQRPWRLFWLCLNTAYVMEFFLQSLVKRHVLSQSTMLCWNVYLMFISSLAAAYSVLSVLQWKWSVLSLFLNLVNRYHDVTNTMFLGTLAVLLTLWQR